MHPAPIKLSAIEQTSPTLWSHMRLCSLRATLAATPAPDRWVLHDPRAWLGSAFHRVVEAINRGVAPADAEAVWNAAVAETVARAASHPFDRRFAAPERWPTYFLIRQRALALAAKLGAPPRQEGGARIGHRLPGRDYEPERRFEARGGRLVGRPDYYDGHTLTEYKSSLPDPAWPHAAAITDSFQRQLRLYAVIIADTSGRWPDRGRVVAASGQTLEVAIDPAACDAEANAALAALDNLNARLDGVAAPEQLAEPGVPACSGCPFQILCPGFWQLLGRGCLETFKDAAIEGVLEHLAPGPDGDLYTVHLAARSTAHGLNPEQAVVLRKLVHGELLPTDVGSLCRLAGGRVRPDGRIGADFSTVVVALPNVPRLETATAPPRVTA
jgi:hypothetical protein